MGGAATRIVAQIATQHIDRLINHDRGRVGNRFGNIGDSLPSVARQIIHIHAFGRLGLTVIKSTNDVEFAVYGCALGFKTRQWCGGNRLPRPRPARYRRWCSASRLGVGGGKSGKCWLKSAK